jgi:hypothetical protein
MQQHLLAMNSNLDSEVCMPKPQAFANHVKFDPPFHFFVLPVLLANVIAMGRLYFHAPSLGACFCWRRVHAAL